MGKKTAIVIHHSLSYWGTVGVIDQWHRERGWSGIGYHKVIENGFPTYTSWQTNQRDSSRDGAIKDGRTPETSTAAAVLEGSMNRKAIHICLIGNFDTHIPTMKQVESLAYCCTVLCKRHSIDPNEIWYHRDFAINRDTGKPYKTCPGLLFVKRDKLRRVVWEALNNKRRKTDKIAKPDAEV